MLDRLLARRSDAGSNTLAAAITAEFYKDGIAAHAKVANPVLQDKRDLTLKGLEENWEIPAFGQCQWAVYLFGFAYPTMSIAANSGQCRGNKV